MSLREQVLRKLEAEGFGEDAALGQLARVIKGETIVSKFSVEHGVLTEVERVVKSTPVDAARGIALYDRLRDGAFFGDKAIGKTDPHSEGIFTAFAPPKKRNIVSRVGSATSSPPVSVISSAPEAGVVAPVAEESGELQEVALPVADE